MLDANIERIAREQIRIQFEDRSASFGREVVGIKSEFTKRNVFHSSMCVQAVARAFEQELRGRAMAALNTLRRVCSEVGVRPPQT